MPAATANQSGVFQIYENAGLSSADFVPSKVGSFQTGENVGLNSAELVSSKEGAFRVYVNSALNSLEFQNSAVVKQPIGWGISPFPNATVVVLNDHPAAYQIYEYVTT